MKVCKYQPYSTKTVKISSLTQLSEIWFSLHTKQVPIKRYVVTASQNCHNHKMFYNIVSFQSSPDIQNCIYQFYTHSVVQF